MTDDFRISKTMAVGMAVVAIVTAIVSVNVGIAIGSNIKKSYRTTATTTTAAGGATASTTAKVGTTYIHPHLVERRLTLIENPEQELNYLREKLSTVLGVSYMGLNIPSTVGELKGKDTDTTASAEVRAAAWLINHDTVNGEEVLLSRFALAHIYYNNGGVTWNNTNNWLSPTESHCTWDGVTCCKNFMFSPVCADVSADPDGITELDLYNNNLIGTIPNSIALLTDLQSVFLSENWLTGTIPPKNVFETLPKLLKLNLQHNTLTGPVPDIWNGVLDAYYVQGNDLNGTWPVGLCPLAQLGNDPKLAHCGLDCDEVTCSTSCCEKWVHCFVHDTKKRK